LVLGTLIATAIAVLLRGPAAALAARLAATPLRPLLTATGRSRLT
jgi:hypothetical protein